MSTTAPPAETAPSASSTAPPAGTPPSASSTAPPAGTAATSTAHTAPGTTGTPTPAPPDRLLIPVLELDEQLIDLGLADDGSMEVPADPDRAGWFTGGGRPGGHGPTVLAGHVDSTAGPAVFGALTRLRPGDEILVENTDGRRVTYRVDRVSDYAKGTFPTEEVFGATPADEVRLITCTGAWDSLASAYEDNRVVYASAEPDP